MNDNSNTKQKNSLVRGLSNDFINSLKSGILSPLLHLTKCDSTLCLEIRENYINIYYRGGNILRIEEKAVSFNASFDKKYLDADSKVINNIIPTLLNSSDDVNIWIDSIPHLKHEMDLWFGKHPKNEREFQQLMVRENNFGNSAKSTDYFICDIEYANPNGRFDLIAAHWPSSPTERKNNKSLGLSFIEMKYLDKALTDTAGLKKHIEDINEFLAKPENLSNLKDEMKVVFNQKLELGLIDNQKPIESFNDNKPEYILALINHDPDSSILRRELGNLPTCQNAELKIAASNFLGYGLYDQSIYNLNAFGNRFQSQIHAKTPIETKAVFHNKSAIITHGDVDGMVCAAQLIHREKINYNVIFSNAKYINSALNRIKRGKTLPPHIYVTDIPANTETESIVKSLVECGIKLTWIDHHPWPDGLNNKLEKLCTVLVYNEAMSTPAGILTGRWANDEGRYSDEIGNICYAFNKGTDWERNWFRLLSSYIGNSEQDVLERLAFNRDFTEADLQRIEQKKDDEQRAKDILNNKPDTVSTKTNKTMAIYDTSQNKGIYLGHKVFQHHDVDFCLIRISKTKWQLACNPSKRHSMQALLGVHETDDMAFSFAGRKNQLLAIELEGKDDNAKSHESLTDWLCDKL